MKRVVLLIFLCLSAVVFCQQYYNKHPVKSSDLLSNANKNSIYITSILFRGLKIKKYNEEEFNQIIELLKVNKNATCAIYIDKQNTRVLRENKMRIQKVIDLIQSKIDIASIKIETHPTTVHNYQFDPIFGGDKKYVKFAQTVIYLSVTYPITTNWKFSHI